MDEITITIRYWVTRIFVPSILASLSLAEIGSKLIGILFEFIVAIILVVGLGQIGTIPNIGVNIATVFLLLLFTLMFRIVLKIIYLPAKIYKDQGGFESNGLKLIVKPDCPKPNPDGWLGFQLENRSKENVEQCVAELKHVTKIEDAKYGIDEPTWLSWSSQEYPREGRKTLLAGGDQRVDMAATNWEKSEIGFQVQNGKHYETGAGHFHTVVTIKGVYRKTRFALQFNLDFSYEGGAKFVCDKNGVEIELAEGLPLALGGS